MIGGAFLFPPLPPLAEGPQIIESKLKDVELVSHIVANLGLSGIKIDPGLALRVVGKSRRPKPPIS